MGLQGQFNSQEVTTSKEILCFSKEKTNQNGKNLSAPLPGTGEALDAVHNLVHISLVCIFLMVCFTAESNVMFRN